MKRLVHQVAGQEVVINQVETYDDLVDFREFVRKNRRILACDSEATGLDMYSDKFRLRLVQFGNRYESYVIPVELGGQFIGDVVGALKFVDKLVFQNGMFDLQVFDRHLGIPMESLWPKVMDTKILAHLVDPRGQDEGGVGHSLEGLTRHYIDAEVADNVKGLMTKIAKEHKTTKAKIWSLIDLNHPEYNLYAGMDTILAARLYNRLWSEVPSANKSNDVFDGMNLVQFEHKIAEICSYMERTGFLLDVEYTQKLSDRLYEDEQNYIEMAAAFGCENVNSTEQVANVLESRGIRITDRTPSGKRKVDKVLLERLVKAGDLFAQSVVEAKKARKWRTTWVDGFLNNRDSDNRCHANINALRARTGRMSITGIPAQTLPSGDWTIRRCFVADEGQQIIACDYQTQELRVLAALAGDEVMQKAFRDGADLHQLTADSAGVSRKVGKTTNFAYVYGSGAKNIAESCGIDVATAKRVIEGFETSYPNVKALSKRLQQQAIRQGFITTPIGRRLPVDERRPYASLNYMVQSSSRDVTARALVRLHQKGFTPYLRLPVHDELILSVPSEKAEWGASKVASIMAEDFQGVHVGTDKEVYGKSWGHGYGATD